MACAELLATGAKYLVACLVGTCWRITPEILNFRIPNEFSGVDVTWLTVLNLASFGPKCNG